jgi:hypothetical protein
MLIVSIGIFDARTNSTMWSALSGVSVSRPRMIPETAS